MTAFRNCVLLCAGFICTIAVVNVDGYRIFMLAGGSKSHKYPFDAVAKVLGERGHEVTIASAVKDEKKVKGVTNLYLSRSGEAMKNSNINFFQGTIQDRAFILSMVNTMVDMCNATYMDPVMQDFLNNPRNAKGEPRFDVVMIDSIFGEFMLPFGYHLKVPVIYLSPSLLFPSIAWSMNIPYPYSYLTNGMDATIHPEGIYERAMNLLNILGFSYFQFYELRPAWDKLMTTIIPDLPTLSELERNVSFVMINWHTAIYPSAPRMPYFIDVGCLNCLERQPLPKDLEDFMNGSPEGVVYFSLGSYTQGSNMPVEMREKVIAGFAKLKQNVLFKYEDEIPGLSPNVKLIKWAPQTDLLGHPKMRLFITHGGGLSMMESAYNGCPQLAFPLSADQHGNMAFAKEKGFAEVLDWKTFTQEEFDQKLQLMLSDKSYAENAAKVSRLMKDNPQDPKEKAAYWVEYVIRHKGAPHLKSGAENLNFFQYFLLDVIGAAVLALAVVLCILFVVLRALCLLVFGKSQKRNVKTKTN